MAYRLDTAGPHGVQYNISEAWDHTHGPSSGSGKLLSASDFVIRTDSSSADVYLKLPDADSGGPGSTSLEGKMFLIIKSESANEVIIQPSTGDTINGTVGTTDTDIKLQLEGAAMWFFCDGNDWFVVAKETSNDLGFTGSAATNLAVPKFDGTTGKQVKASGVIIDDSGNNNVSGIGQLTATSINAALSSAVTVSFTGDVTGSWSSTLGPGATPSTALTIAAAAVHHGMLAEDIISGQSELAHADIQDADDLMIHDATAGAVLKVGVDSLRDHYFAAISGDATVADGGALTIANDAVEQAMIADDAVGADQLASNAVVTASIVDNAVTLAKMAGLARGKFIYGDASGDPAALAAGADGKILVADANGDPSWTTLSGDATLSAGALTIASGAVEHAMLANDAVDGDNIADDSIDSEHYVDGSIDTAHIADNQVTLAKMAGLAAGKIILGDASGDPAAVTLSGDVTVSNAGVTTIAAQAVEYAMIDPLAIKDEDNMASDSASHLATQQSIKAYVDSVAAGLDVKASVVVATTAALPACTYNNGSSGDGATLTGNANGALANIDDVALSAGDRLLVKDQADASQNGVYVVTRTGDGGSAFALTRAADFNASSEFIGSPFFFVESGTDNGAHGFVSSLVNAPTLGSTDLTFYQFSAPGQDAVAGDGLAMSGNVLSVGVDGSSIEISSDRLQVKAGGITNAMLDGSIANSKLSNSTVSYGGVQLALGASDATPAFDLTDATNYPTSSLVGTITNAQLAGSIDNSKLANSTVSYGGVQLSLGGSDATPAFDLSDATSLPAGSVVAGTFASSSNWSFSGSTISNLGTVSAATSITSTAFVGPLTGNVTGNVTGNLDGIIGGSSPAAGSFTDLTASGDVHVDGDLVIDGAWVMGANGVQAVTSATSLSATDSIVTLANTSGSIYALDLAANVASMTTGQKWYIMMPTTSTANNAPVRLEVKGQNNRLNGEQGVGSGGSAKCGNAAYFMYDTSAVFEDSVSEGADWITGCSRMVEVSVAIAGGNAFFTVRPIYDGLQSWTATDLGGASAGPANRSANSVSLRRDELFSPSTKLHIQGEGEYYLASKSLEPSGDNRLTFDMSANSNLLASGVTVLICNNNPSGSGTNAGITITLPDPSAITDGRVFWIKCPYAGSNSVTVNPHNSSAALIDGAATFVIEQDHAAVKIFSDGSNWWVL